MAALAAAAVPAEMIGLITPMTVWAEDNSYTHRRQTKQRQGKMSPSMWRAAIRQWSPMQMEKSLQF